MQTYKIISSDLDGTLLNSAMTISSENKGAIRKLTEKGIQFVANSGRAWDEMPEEVKTDPNIRYCICSNGTVIYDKQTGQRYATYYSDELYRQVLSILRRYDTFMALHRSGHSYSDVSQFNEAIFQRFHINEYWVTMYRRTAIFTDHFEFEELLKASEETESIVVFFHSMEDLHACASDLHALGIKAVPTAENNLEIFCDQSGKGNALLRLADLLGVDHADTIALGDTCNDAEMLQAAGLGLAMQNAWDDLKAIADQILPVTNDQHVAAYILEHYTK